MLKMKYVFFLSLIILLIKPALTQEIVGSVFIDQDFNCSFNLGERGLEGILVQFIEVNSNDVVYVYTDTLGQYSISLDIAAIYQVKLGDISPLLDLACPTNFNSISIGIGDTLNLPVYVPSDPCEYLSVKMSSGEFVIGNYTEYVLNYCNYGTIVPGSPYIDVAFDKYLLLDTLVFPVSFYARPLGNNKYRIRVNPLEIGECNSISLFVALDPTVEEAQSVCSRVDIYPKNFSCLSHLWDGPVLDVKGRCSTNEDSIILKVTNIGLGPVGINQKYSIIEEHVIYLPPNNPPILASGDSSDFLVLPRSASSAPNYRILLSQEVGMPKFLGDSILTFSIEGCNDQVSSFSKGKVTELKNGPTGFYSDTDCKEVKTASRKNHVEAFPKGIENVKHYIYPNSRIKYTLTFQDTSSRPSIVKIESELSSFLDPETIIFEGSNVEGSFSIARDGSSIEFRTKEPSGAGLFSFSAHQKRNNPNGTIIENSSRVYFGNNLGAEFTDIYHEVYENPYGMLLKVDLPSKEESSVLVYPNPFQNSAFIQVDKENNDNEGFNFVVFDLVGRKVYEEYTSQNILEFHRKNLKAGIYLFRVDSKNGFLATGKIIVK